MLSSVANNGFPKEEIQITCANHTLVIYGFERMVVCSPAGQETFSLPEADKGLKAMLDMTVKVIRAGTPAPVGVREAWRASRTTIAAVQSVRTRQLVELTRMPS